MDSSEKYVLVPRFHADWIGNGVANHTSPIIERALHAYLSRCFGEGWVDTLPEETLGVIMPAFFSGAAAGITVAGSPYAGHLADAVADIEEFAKGAP